MRRWPAVISGLIVLAALVLARVSGAEMGAATIPVAIELSAFVPSQVNIGLGDTVRWTNKDGFAHTVTSNQPLFNSGVISPGLTFGYMFNTPGDYIYHCTIHTNMGGLVHVAATASTATATATRTATATPAPNYLALIVRPPPTPTATPIPPSLATLVIQLVDMPSGFTVDEFREVTNAEAAQSYLDPAAALAAFAAQGRESAWFVRYLSDDYIFTDASGVSDQAVRYLTPEGADAGLDYAVADEVAEFPDYGTILIFPPIEADRTVAKLRTYTSDGITYRKYFFALRKGRYVAIVQVVGLSSALNVHSKAAVYARKAAARLP